MKKPEVVSNDDSKSLSLTLSKMIRATPEKIFQAWTDPDRLKMWWGPNNVACIGAEVDLQVGGVYRIGNRLSDGSEIWIYGEFEEIDPPKLLRFTWRVEPGKSGTERVTVKFDATEIGTEVTVHHEQISSHEIKKSHTNGWIGCFEGLVDYLKA